MVEYVLKLRSRVGLKLARWGVLDRDTALRWMGAHMGAVEKRLSRIYG